MITQTYRFGRFTAEDATDLYGQRVTIKTHEDETYGPHFTLYLPGKPYLMLLAKQPTIDEELPLPEVNVFLEDVATVTIH